MKTLETVRIPNYGKALLDSLQFAEPSHVKLSNLNAAEWNELLPFCDRQQMTLLLGHLAEQELPLRTHQRIRRNRENSAARYKRLQDSLNEITQAFSHRSIETVLLKGATHAPHFTADPLLRSAGDIDLWCRRADIGEAKQTLGSLGYRPIGRSKGRHLDPMIREQVWDWSGDYYSPEIPIPVDLHYQLWDEEEEFLQGPNEEQMWNRCTPIPDSQTGTRQLVLQDMLAFAALHALMHLLHGDTRLQRTWEIGFFLQQHVHDTNFWHRWSSLYQPEVRHLQILVFSLAEQWFGCPLPVAIANEQRTLPDAVQRWVSKYGWSPVESLLTPNKDELWLHLALLKSIPQKTTVLLRRLLPVHAVASGGSPAISRWTAATHAGSRVKHHLVSLPATCWSGLRWWLEQ